MALRSVIPSKLPMIVIMGATGSGKTKLSLELAQKLNTEIISADSMQVYRGLDVVSAKVSAEEQRSVRHHLIDILEPHQNFTVVDFRNRALGIIDDLMKQGKVPIIVGGTNYYIESIVYHILVENMDDSEALLWDKQKRKRDFSDDEADDSKQTKRDPEVSETDVKEEEEKEQEINKKELIEVVNNEKNYTNEEIYEKLKAIDPVMASRHHLNNRRKVLRSIEVWLKTGRKHSEILDEQKVSEGKLRRPGLTVLLWLRCLQSVHDARLDARIDDMLENGLIDELLDFHARHNQQRIKDGTSPDYTKGIFQTLGFKEFHSYLTLPPEERNSERGSELFRTSLENMRVATRRYSRRQNKMVRARFLEHPLREVPPIYELDTTDLENWDENVKNKAIHIVESYINNTPCKYEPLKRESKEKTNNTNQHSSNYCEICERRIIGDKEYAIHLNSNRHKRVIKKKEKINQEKKIAPK